MALVTCAECGNKISTSARQCPKCGATGASVSKRGMRIFGLLLIPVTLLIFSAYILYERFAREDAVQRIVMCAKANGMNYFTQDFANQQIATLTENGTDWREAADSLAILSDCPHLAHYSD